MNWLVFALVSGAAAWFEYNYQRSKHPPKPKPDPTPINVVPETAHVEQMGASPSISPGSENDKKLNLSA